MAEQAPKESTFDHLSDNTLVRNMVFLGSGLVALGTAGFAIWQEFYAEMVKREPFKSLRAERDHAKGLAHAAGENVESIQRGMKEADAAYTKAVTAALEQEGVSSRLWSGTWQRLKQLGTFDKLGIAMKTGASLGVTLGTYYLINQNVRLKASNQYQDDRLKELGDRINEQAQRHTADYEHVARSR
jgi:hypothetical protein